MKHYKTDDIIIIYNNLKSCYDTIAYCVATNNYKFVYLYLSRYCELFYLNYELISLNLINFQDILIFENFNFVEDLEKIRSEI